MQEIYARNCRTLLTDTESIFTMRSSRPGFASVALILAAGLLPVAGCNRGHNADVVATVNGKAIMQAELDKAYKAQLGDATSNNAAAVAGAGRLAAVECAARLIDEEIVEQRAAKMNLTATNEEVDAKLAEMKAPYTEEQFQRAAEGQQSDAG